MKIKSFECPKSIRNYKENNAWNIRHLLEESFVPANQRTSVLYCRLSDFKTLFELLCTLLVFVAKTSTENVLTSSTVS